MGFVGVHYKSVPMEVNESTRSSTTSTATVSGKTSAAKESQVSDYVTEHFQRKLRSCGLWSSIVKSTKLCHPSSPRSPQVLPKVAS